MRIPVLKNLLVAVVLGWSPALLSQNCPAPQSSSLTPTSSTSLIHGSQVSFMIGMKFVPIPLNSCRYHIQLVYNKKKYGVYDFQLLPLAPLSSGQITANMFWFVKITGPEKVPVTLRLVTQTNSQVPQTAEVSQTNDVVCDPNSFWFFRFADRRLHRCQ
jgi:hypothetical protein